MRLTNRRSPRQYKNKPPSLRKLWSNGNCCQFPVDSRSLVPALHEAKEVCTLLHEETISECSDCHLHYCGECLSTHTCGDELLAQHGR